jgi:hypothetical protein
VRAVEEEIARSTWHAAEHDARAAEDAEEGLRARVAEARDDLLHGPGGAATGALDARRHLVGERALEGLVAALRAAHERALTRRGQGELLRDAWGQREAEERGLAELRARSLDRHRRALDREEALLMDEVALARRQRAARPAHPEFDSSGRKGTTDEGSAPARSPAP